MGRASSSKKVARAAGTGGGRTSGRRVPWTYYGVIALVVLLGLVGTVSSRDRRAQIIADQGSGQPAVGGTPWNEAFAVYVCGAFEPNILIKNNPAGISSAGDGIIHIAPLTKNVAGKNAILTVYATAVGMTLTPGTLKLPGQKAHQDGDACQGGKGHVYLKQFPYAGAPTGILVKGDPGNVRLADQQELVVAFVPSNKSATIPGPPAPIVARMRALSTPVTPTTTIAPSVPTTAVASVPTTPTTTTRTTPTTPTTLTAPTTTPK